MQPDCPEGPTCSPLTPATEGPHCQVPWKEESFFLVTAPKSRSLASFAGCLLTPKCLWNTRAICELCLQVCYAPKITFHRLTESLRLQGPQIQPLTTPHHFPLHPDQRSARAEPAEGKGAFPTDPQPVLPELRYFGRDRHFKPPFIALISMIVCTDMLMVVFLTQIQKLGCNKYLHLKKNLLYWLSICSSHNSTNHAVSSTV